MIENEQKISLTEAVKHWPGRPHVSAIWRACRRGIRAANGKRVYLDHARWGAKIFTSREAIERFGRQLAEFDAEHFRTKPSTQKVPRRRYRNRTKAIAAAKARVARNGI